MVLTRNNSRRPHLPEDLVGPDGEEVASRVDVEEQDKTKDPKYEGNQEEYEEYNDGSYTELIALRQKATDHEAFMCTRMWALSNKIKWENDILSRQQIKNKRTGRQALSGSLLKVPPREILKLIRRGKKRFEIRKKFIPIPLKGKVHMGADSPRERLVLRIGEIGGAYSCTKSLGKEREKFKRTLRSI
uniref:Uncharacterized protein n=1 Tax=Cannabis sativa TaxID=3483 RepID=A0A803PTW1_CANSA